jgi:hypothetical protein
MACSEVGRERIKKKERYWIQNKNLEVRGRIDIPGANRSKK